MVCDGFEKLLFENMSLSETKNINISKDQMNNENFLQSNNTEITLICFFFEELLIFGIISN